MNSFKKTVEATVKRQAAYLTEITTAVNANSVEVQRIPELDAAVARLTQNANCVSTWASSQDERVNALEAAMGLGGADEEEEDWLDGGFDGSDGAAEVAADAQP